MNISRTNVELDRQTHSEPTWLMTERNKYEAHCGVCAKPVYVDEETFCFTREAIESGLDNPFRCEHCAEEYDDLVFEG